MIRSATVLVQFTVFSWHALSCSKLGQAMAVKVVMNQFIGEGGGGLLVKAL